VGAQAWREDCLLPGALAGSTQLQCRVCVNMWISRCLFDLEVFMQPVALKASIERNVTYYLSKCKCMLLLDSDAR